MPLVFDKGSQDQGPIRRDFALPQGSQGLWLADEPHSWLLGDDIKAGKLSGVRVRCRPFVSSTNGRHLALTPDELASLDIVTKLANSRGLGLQAKAPRIPLRQDQKLSEMRSVAPY